MKRILLTGGGTAGHVTPNIALLPRLRELDYDIHYIGSYDGIERKLIEEFDIPYYGISSGKLRRYMSLKNLSDPFHVLKGYAQAHALIKRIKPDVIFSKGGFVTVPVVMAAKALKIPTIIHESDLTPGLANKLCIPAATKVCCNFPETLNYLPEGKAVLTGSPIRSELMEGNAQIAKDFCQFPEEKPTILIVGGSTGSAIINETIRGVLPELLKEYNVIHICGKDKTDSNLDHFEGYRQYEYLKKELSHVLALADLVISRAGANAICELLALRKPNILIPLSAKASRGDQILNAASFEAQGFSSVLQEDELSNLILLSTIRKVLSEKDKYQETMASSKLMNSIETIISLIEEVRK